jgi:hypothetical protein
MASMSALSGPGQAGLSPPDRLPAHKLRAFIEGWTECRPMGGQSLHEPTIAGVLLDAAPARVGDAENRQVLRCWRNFDGLLLGVATGPSPGHVVAG